VVEGGVSTAATGVESVLAKAVVRRSLVLVREAVVRFGDALERLLRVRVALVLVRVPADRRLFVGLANLLLGGVARDAEHLVVVFGRWIRHRPPSNRSTT
jgi:hypothetical protein